MTDTTQPSDETLAERIRAAVTYQYMPMAVRKLLSEAAVALTRRAGGDAIPAGWQLVPVEATDEWVHSLANWRQGQRDTPRCEPPGGYELRRAREDITAILAATPKPPAGGDAGAVERAYRQGQIDMRDRAAAVCDKRGAEEQESYGLNRAAQNYFRARNAVRDLEPAALALPAPVVEGDAEKEARFLCERLEEFEREITDDDLFTQFNGHVAPSAARLRAALSEGRSHG